MPRQESAIHESRKTGHWADSLDASLTALTPEGIEFVLSPAGFSVRTFAYAVDKTIQWFVLTIISLVFMYFLRGVIGIWLLLILNFIIEWFYYVFFDLFFRGQSPGKKIMGIRVVKSDGSPVDPASSFLRNLLRFADTFFSLFHISFISIAASEGFRRIGDWAGGTLVVYSSIAKNTLPGSLKNLLEKYEPQNPLRPLSSDEKQAVMDFARRYPLLGEARANEIASLLKQCDIYAQSASEENSGITNAARLMGIARRLSGDIL